MSLKRKNNLPIIRRVQMADGNIISTILKKSTEGVKIPPVTTNINLEKGTKTTLYIVAGTLGGLYIVGRIAGAIKW